MGNVYVCDYITQKKLSLSNIFNFMNISSSFVWFLSNNYHIKDYFYNTNRKNITRYINNHNINVQNILRVNRHLRICMGQKLVAVFYIKNCTVNLKLKTFFFFFTFWSSRDLTESKRVCVCALRLFRCEPGNALPMRRSGAEPTERYITTVAWHWVLNSIPLT